MGKIQILPVHLANQIAAGEVVERPASVVKELVENALDAGTEQVDIEIEQGGIKRIVVSDRGGGMDEEDLSKSVLRHGTSKIIDENDLHQIKSMGFRGEALASIGAVSRLSIRSRTPEMSAGRVLRVEFGSQEQPKPIGMTAGTRVEVADLFDNVPARKKFLRTPATEMRYISETVMQQAFGFPSVGFSLKHNGRMVLSVPANQHRHQRIKTLLPSFANEMVEVSYDHPHLQVTGWIGLPQTAIESKAPQYILVNNRAVNDRLISRAVKEGYGSLLMTRAQPVFVLYIQLPVEMVDVNVHPRKQEVRFVNSNSIFQAVKQSVESGLKRAHLTYAVRTPSMDGEQKNGEEASQTYDFTHSDKSFSFIPGTSSGISEKMPAAYPSQAVSDSQRGYQTSTLKSYIDSQQQWLAEVVDQAPARKEILQVLDLYLLTQSEEGLLVIDQHAAHERILYEKFIRVFKSKQSSLEKQQLLVPLPLAFSPAIKLVFEEYMELITQIGFEFEELDGTWQVSAVPMILSNRKIETLMYELLGDLQEGETTKSVDSQSHRVVTYLACRSAIKGGDFLSMGERIQLLQQLSECELPYTCPHGRPVTIVISELELEKMFKRVG